MTGVAALAVLLALQPQGPTDSTADSLKAREYVSVGGAAMAGNYIVIVRVPGSRIATRRERDHHTVGVTAGWRRETPKWAFGLRGQLFSGSDQANKRGLANGFRTTIPEDSAFTTPLSGGAAMLDIDGLYVGLSAGVIAGNLITKKSDQPVDFPSPVAAGSVRVGLLSRFFGEVEVHDHDPTPAPGSEVKVSAVFVDDGGNRYHLGFADSGPFIEAQVATKYGFEFTPFFSGGDNGGFSFSLRVARRFPLRR